MSGHDLLEPFTREVCEFVLDALGGADTARGLRVIEVGAGDGSLAALLGEAGVKITAIDASPDAVARAAERGNTVHHGDWLVWEDGPYDAVLFTRSLHHIDPLDEAVAHAAEMAPGGLLILDEFAREQLDDRGAQLLFDSRCLLSAVGLIDGEPAPSADPRGDWHHRFTAHHRISRGSDVLAAVAAHAEISRHERVPFIGRFLTQFLDADHPQAAAAAAAVVELERLRIEAGSLPPIGFRLVARLGNDGAR